MQQCHHFVITRGHSRRACARLTTTWKEGDGAAVIKGTDNWTCKIGKKGDPFKNGAWEPNANVGGQPTIVTEISKVN